MLYWGKALSAAKAGRCGGSVRPKRHLAAFLTVVARRLAPPRSPPRPPAALRTASSMVGRMHGDGSDEREDSFASGSTV